MRAGRAQGRRADLTLLDGTPRGLGGGSHCPGKAGLLQAHGRAHADAEATTGRLSLAAARSLQLLSKELFSS